MLWGHIDDATGGASFYEVRDNLMSPVAFFLSPVGRKHAVYLLYVDESGNENDAADKHFILAGVAVFERQAFYLSRSVDEIQNRHFPGVPPIEFHASAIRAGRGFWRRVDPAQREAVLQDVGKAIINIRDPGLVLFSAVIEKSDRLWGEAAVARATEEICNRFDIFLMRRHHEAGDPQRGLIIFSEGHLEARSKVWVKDFRELGTRWGVIKNLCDIPYFASARETRLLQIADFISYAVFLLYERRDPSLFQIIVDRFEEKDGTLHGLFHHRKNPACDCPACFSRKTPSDFGPWLS